MFYYTNCKKPKLEVNIVESYTEADVERIFLFIEALMDNPKTKVIFKVHPSIIKKFEHDIANRSWHPLYAYNVKENVA